MAEVSTWIAQIEAELAQLDAELAPLLDRQTALAERLGLLKRLLASLSADAHPLAGVPAATAAGSPARVYASVRDRVQAHASEILTEAERPLHINEIHAEFIRRGYEVPGAGKPNNITVHLSHADSIDSTSWGYYAVKADRQPESTVKYPVVDESRTRRAHG